MNTVLTDLNIYPLSYQYSSCKYRSSILFISPTMKTPNINGASLLISAG